LQTELGTRPKMGIALGPSMEALIDWAFLRREQFIQEDKKQEN